MLDPPVPLAARPLVEAVNFVTVALLPERIRHEYGFFPLPPAWVRRALVSGGAEYVKRGVIPSSRTGCGTCRSRAWRRERR